MGEEELRMECGVKHFEIYHHFVIVLANHPGTNNCVSNPVCFIHKVKQINESREIQSQRSSNFLLASLLR